MFAWFLSIFSRVHDLNRTFALYLLVHPGLFVLMSCRSMIRESQGTICTAGQNQGRPMTSSSAVRHGPTSA